LIRINICPDLGASRSCSERSEIAWTAKLEWF
jgi:hypothetical protein